MTEYGEFEQLQLVWFAVSEIFGAKAGSAVFRCHYDNKRQKGMMHTEGQVNIQGCFITGCLSWNWQINLAAQSRSEKLKTKEMREKLLLYDSSGLGKCLCPQYPEKLFRFRGIY